MKIDFDADYGANTDGLYGRERLEVIMEDTYCEKKEVASALVLEIIRQDCVVNLKEDIEINLSGIEIDVVPDDYLDELVPLFLGYLDKFDIGYRNWFSNVLLESLIISESSEKYITFTKAYLNKLLGL